MNIEVRCPDCGKSVEPGPVQAILVGTLESVMGGDEPTGGAATDCLTRALLRLVETYVRGPSAPTTEKLDLEICALVDALCRSDDLMVKELSVVNRQALWAALSMLRRIRESKKAEG